MDDNPIAVPSLAKLAAALVSFQSEVPVIPKSRTAKAGSFSYQYADIADILNAIREPMAKNKLAITQLLIGGKDGFTTIRTTIWHESGENLSSDMEVKTEGKSAQDAGSLFTYYKRYALGAALGIATEEDDDGKAAGSPTPPAKQIPTRAYSPPAPVQAATLGNEITPKQLAKMQIMLGELGIETREERLDYVAEVIGRRVESSRDLTKSEGVKVIDRLYSLQEDN